MEAKCRYVYRDSYAKVSGQGGSVQQGMQRCSAQYAAQYGHVLVGLYPCVQAARAKEQPLLSFTVNAAEID